MPLPTLTKTLSVIAITLWLGSVGVGAVWYFGGQSAALDRDNRKVVQLQDFERDTLLSEMRILLRTVQTVVSSLAENDRVKLALSARAISVAGQKTLPASLMLKLPAEMRSLREAAYISFDEIADLAATGTQTEILSRLDGLMTNCVACHEGYRLEATH